MKENALLADTGAMQPAVNSPSALVPLYVGSKPNFVAATSHLSKSEIYPCPLFSLQDGPVFLTNPKEPRRFFRLKNKQEQKKKRKKKQSSQLDKTIKHIEI